MRATVAGIIAGVVLSVGFAGPSIAGPAQIAVQKQAAGQIESNVHKTFGWCDRGYGGAVYGWGYRPRVYGWRSRPRVYGWRSRPRVYGWRSRPRVYGYRRYSPRVYGARIYGPRVRGYRSRRAGVRVYGYTGRRGIRRARAIDRRVGRRIDRRRW